METKMIDENDNDDLILQQFNYHNGISLGGSCIVYKTVYNDIFCIT